MLGPAGEKRPCGLSGPRAPESGFSCLTRLHSLGWEQSGVTLTLSLLP